MESPQCQPGGQASPHPKLGQVLQSQQARHLCTSREPGCGLAERNPRSHCGPLACPLRPLHWLSFLFSTAQPEMSGEVVTRNCGLLTQEPRTATDEHETDTRRTQDSGNSTPDCSADVQLCSQCGCEPRAPAGRSPLALELARVAQPPAGRWGRLHSLCISMEA